MARTKSVGEMRPRCMAALFCTVLLCMAPVLGHAQTVKYIHTDALGSVVAVTDGNRNVIERREYEPYGAQLTPAVADGPGYTGHVQDAATKLVYMQQRYYDPGIGRFLSVDPVRADPNSGDSFNRYAYVNNNPYTNKDPTGAVCVRGVSTAFCDRSLRYEAIDRAKNVRALTRFFGAASIVTNAMGPEWGSINNSLSANLEIKNLARLNVLLRTGGAGSVKANDYAFVEFEQSEVQNFLDNMKASDPGLYAEYVEVTNGMLNSSSTRLFSRFGDPKFSRAIERTRKELGRDIDYASQSDREAIGKNLTDIVRSSRTLCTGTRLRTC